MEIKILSKEHISDVVLIHKQAFSDFFLTQLGDDFLTTYYACFRKAQNGILLGLFENNELCGFCASTTLSKGFNTQLIKNNFIPFSWIAIKLLFLNPKALIRLIKNFTKKNSAFDDNGDYAELFSIGVSPSKQGKGIGRQLLSYLENKLSSKNCNEITLTTDYYDNEKSINFYKNIGYSIFYEFIAYPNRKMYRMNKRLK